MRLFSDGVGGDVERFEALLVWLDDVVSEETFEVGAEFCVCHEW